MEKEKISIEKQDRKIESSKIIKNKTKQCKVIVKQIDSIGIDFDGFGILINQSIKKDHVEVEYSGKIGKPDFKIISVK